MKSAIVVAVLFLATDASAGVFGNVTLRRLTYGHDQAGCATEEVIKDVYQETGVDFVEGSASKSWDCADTTSSTADARRCPYPQYTVGREAGMQGFRCFANGDAGVAVCVSGATSAQVPETYAVYRGPGSPTRTENVERARVRELFILSKNNLGFRADHYYRFDNAGCQVEAFEGMTYQGCADLFQSALTGSTLYDPDISEQRFCDPANASDSNSISGHADKLKKIGECLRRIPNFRARYQAGLARGPASVKGEKKAGAQKKAPSKKKS